MLICTARQLANASTLESNPSIASHARDRAEDHGTDTGRTVQHQERPKCPAACRAPMLQKCFGTVLTQQAALQANGQ